MVILIIIKSYIYYNNYTIYNNNFKYIKMIDQKKNKYNDCNKKRIQLYK